MNLSQVVDVAENQRTMNILDVLIIALPGVLLLCAATVALTTNPDAQPVSRNAGGRTRVSNVAYSSLQVQEGM
jgi:hypothetical protein